MKDYFEVSDIFSKASPVYDDKISQNKTNLIIRDIEVNTLEHYIKEFNGNLDRILEVGCGTGQEALRIMKKFDIGVDCIDISNGMLKISVNKIKNHGLSDKFRPMRLAASNLDVLKRRYKIVYSFNGALNTEPQFKKFIKSIESVLDDEGVLIFSIRNRYCISDFIYSMLNFNGRRIKERITGDVQVPVAEFFVESRYFSYNEILNLFNSDFKLIRAYGLGIIIFPYISNFFPNGFFDNFMEKLEKSLSKVFPFNMLGDEILYVFKKR